MTRFILSITLGLVLCLPVLPDSGGPAYAYDFSPAERALADNPSLSPPPSQQQWERDQAQAQRNQQDLERAHNSLKQFDPREYTQPAPWSLQQGGGRSQVCRRGYNNSVTCN